VENLTTKNIYRRNLSPSLGFRKARPNRPKITLDAARRRDTLIVITPS